MKETETKSETESASIGHIPSIVVVNELGHLLNGTHEDLGMMGSRETLEEANIYVQPLYFEDLTKSAIRGLLPSRIVKE